MSDVEHPKTTLWIVLLTQTAYWVSASMCVKPLQSCPTICDPMNRSQPGSSVHGILQEYWSGFPFPFPGDLPDLGIEPVAPALQVDSLHWTTGEAHGVSAPSLNSYYETLLFFSRILGSCDHVWIPWLLPSAMGYWTIGGCLTQTGPTRFFLLGICEWDLEMLVHFLLVSWIELCRCQAEVWPSSTMCLKNRESQSAREWVGRNRLIKRRGDVRE